MNTRDAPTVVTSIPGPLGPGTRWQPEVRTEAHRLVGTKLKLDPKARSAVLNAATSILSRGVSPLQPTDHITGLVVGYVQSGKTLSFTTVVALTRDNNFQLVIVVAGTSTPLLVQSTQRLRKDLGVDEVTGNLRWVTYTNPADNENNRRYIKQSLEEWRDPQVPANERATILITVMKNHRHLTNLVTLLDRMELDCVPTLIIDDEADQASLNTLVNRGRESTTYTRLLELRSVVPCHTFLQYTATPQAPLLINIIDALSPQFVEVLDPGDDYVGGEMFFCGAGGLTRVIPVKDIPSATNELPSAPPSLLDALRVFLVGVAAGLIQGRSETNARRSMLVHPSQRTAEHREYRQWIGLVLDEWQRLLSLEPTELDRVDLIDEFHNAYHDLSQTVPQLPPFEQIAAMLMRAFRQTAVEEVNARSGRTPTVDWTRAYGWILIGGQAMDRGFTVEGLTVTYMPRGPGVGNADTIQQRARFFGYKRQYLGFCRIYLQQEALMAFEQYVNHEQEMRQQLKDFGATGQPLRNWKRNFVLSPALKPCRNNVIQFDYARGRYADQWFFAKMVCTPDEVTSENREIVVAFERSLAFLLNTTFVSQHPAQQHLVCDDVPLQKVLSDLLVGHRVSDARDTQDMTGLLLQLVKALESDQDETTVVYRMRPNYQGSRDIDVDGRIVSVRRLFQGPTRDGSGTYSYPGDMRFLDRGRVTVQIHCYDLKRAGHVVAKSVPIVAVWVPRRMKLDWLVQHQAE